MGFISLVVGHGCYCWASNFLTSKCLLLFFACVGWILLVGLCVLSVKKCSCGCDRIDLMVYSFFRLLKLWNIYCQSYPIGNLVRSFEIFCFVMLPSTVHFSELFVQLHMGWRLTMLPFFPYPKVYFCTMWKS